MTTGFDLLALACGYIKIMLGPASPWQMCDALGLCFPATIKTYGNIAGQTEM